jgi:hypothetical protein
MNISISTPVQPSNQKYHNPCQGIHRKMAAPMQQLAAACLPAYVCPPGTKMHLLNLGTMNVDEGWYVKSTSLDIPFF